MTAIWLLIGIIVGYSMAALPVLLASKANKAQLELRLQEVEDMYDNVSEQMGVLAGTVYSFFTGSEKHENEPENGPLKTAKNAEEKVE